MTNLKSCAFGHLMTQHKVTVGASSLHYFGHVHEDDALACAAFDKEGWPSPADVEWRQANPGMTPNA